MKVVATQFIVFILCLSLFIRTLISTNRSDLLINSAFLITTIIIGLLLVRSVIHEVEQREKLQLLAGDLEKANDRLKELDQLKSEFLSLATHQIRAPLTAIGGYAANLMEGDYGEISPKVRGAIQIIATSSKNLVVIVGEFLDISRIEQGRMKYELSDFDASSLIQEVIAELKPTIDKAHLSMKFDMGSYVTMAHGDAGKIKQIIHNIIDNSIKYTPQGAVNISLSTTDSMVRITVSDTGIGISAEDIPKLFAKFVRTKDANKTNVIGTGLGLYIAKQMIEAQEGKIWVESEGVGRGSTFYIELPKSKK